MNECPCGIEFEITDSRTVEFEAEDSGAACFRTGNPIFRITFREDTTEHWNEKRDFVPMRGEVIIYTDHGQIEDEFHQPVNVPGIKIGDGDAYLIDLPFAGDDVRYQILTELRMHSGNTQIHVTAEEKAFWNNKLNCFVSNGNLILNRL